MFDVSVSETDNIATFTIFRSGNLNIDTVVDFSTFDGTALAGFDFVEVSGSAFFNPGTSSLSVLVPLLDDTDVEDTDEDFSLAIIGADNAEFDGTSFGTATFGAEAGLSIGDVAVSESAGTATFTVTRTASLDVTATVDFSTVAGTAAAGSDYTATSGTLTFAAGVTSQNVTVSLIDDEVSESAEFFTVDLSNAVNAELVDDTGLATISDDDSGSGGATTLAIGSATGSENPGNAVFTVTRSGDTSGTTTVQFTTTGTTANAGSDFSATSGTLTFAAGVTTQFITVPVLADVLFEPTERFFVTLSNPSTGASITAPTGQATITDNPKSLAAGQFLSDLADGSNGFVINGVTNLDSSGRSVSAAGDVNGDGIADFIIGADGADPVSSLEGETYVVFGATNVGSSGTIELSALNGANGFQLNGINIGDGSGYSVSAADVNGDGRSDLIIGAPYGDPFANAGETYVVFGQTNFGAVFDLSNGGSGLDGTNGFVINGAAANIRSGRAVSSAGDVNNDGIQDLIIGAPFANTSVGVSYLVFGATNVGSSGTISLGSLDGTNGFEITGIDSTSKTGNSVAAAGDFNGDGIDDFVTGVPYADGVSGNDNGEIYVIFGATNIGLGGSLAFGTDGFIINGIDTYDYAGYSVSNAGDVNGDGIADLLIGAKGADPNSNNTSGETYVVFGATNFGAGGTLNLSALTGSNGFTINGIDVGDESGKAVSGPGDVNDNGTVGESYIIFGATNIGAGGAVSGAGDVNGDGVNDIIIGAYQADPNGGNSGESFVVFGGTNLGGATRPTLDLRSLDGDIGFTVNGIDTSDGAGFSVSGAGDVNGDGFEDFLVGAPYADPFGSSSGEAYLVFGGSSIGSGGALDLNTILATGLAGANGYVFNGSGSGSDAGIAVSGAGDVNGDGIADLIIGARDANSAGQSYVVFGGAASLSALDAANGSTDGQITLVQLGTTATNGVNGFTINAVTGGDDAGRSVRSGDVNGDGIDDLIIGAPYADPNANSGAGEAYVLFGGSTVGSGDGIIDLASDLGGTGGFVLNGITAGDNLGLSVNSAGDVNGDGIVDMIAGAHEANSGKGKSFVVFGATNVGSSGTIEASDLNGTNGFVVNGIDSSEDSGYSVSGAGDFNGDGISDFIIGAPYADPSGNNEGRAYLIFGASNVGAGGTIEASALNGTNGFVINGSVEKRHIGGSVSSIGDFNGDGFDDVLLGSYTEGAAYAGGAFVVFGGASVGSSGTLNISAPASGAGFEIPEKLESDSMGDHVRGAGDLNGDGFDDLIIGARDATPATNQEGESYVIFGGDFSQAITKQGTSGNDLLTGTGSADVFVGGLGNDTLLGNGGVDVLRGGAGDDILSVSNSAFRSLDGGTHTTATGGGDVLAFDSGGTTLDLTAIPDSKTESIEIIDIGGSNASSANTLVLQLTDVLNLSEATNEIKIFGDADDFVSTSGEAWNDGGNVVVDGETFKKFTLGGGTLLADFVVDTTQIPLI